MKITTAIREVKNGVDLFQMPKNESLKALAELQKEGKQYITACENQDELGRCKGHTEPEEKESVKSIDLLKEGVLLPPPTNKCQECAVGHEPTQAHDANSLFYQMHFKKEYDRWPTWKDAISHCPQEIKDFWISQLKEHNINI